MALPWEFVFFVVLCTIVVAMQVVDDRKAARRGQRGR